MKTKNKNDKPAKRSVPQGQSTPKQIKRKTC